MRLINVKVLSKDTTNKEKIDELILDIENCFETNYKNPEQYILSVIREHFKLYGIEAFKSLFQELRYVLKDNVEEIKNEASNIQLECSKNNKVMALLLLDEMFCAIINHSLKDDGIKSYSEIYINRSLIDIIKNIIKPISEDNQIKITELDNLNKIDLYDIEFN